ncbi:MAG TPA: UbiA family prenyltransferase [Bryobacteraceae bacterium]|nr:UbiA family prenyltransferase [Bryobacteraceae bacterium]
MAEAAAPASVPSPQASGQQRRSIALLLVLRPHQWAKNLLVFLPPLFNHAWTNGIVWREALYAFVALSLCASAIYILNDIMDAETDRLHPEKRRRPIAARMLIPAHTLVLASVLLLGAAAVTFPMDRAFAAYLGIYAALALAYVFGAKRIAILDIMILAALYTVRILAGGAATGIVVSAWLLAFSVFFFFSVALAKRCSELTTWGDRASGRPYGPEDYRTLSIAGMASGYAAVVVFAQYVHSPDTASLYRHPAVLWLACPILLYWITRVWLLTNRGRMHEDAVLFALQDKASYLAGLLTAVVLFCAL